MQQTAPIPTNALPAVGWLVWSQTRIRGVETSR
jgi:hypothetical protein